MNEIKSVLAEIDISKLSDIRERSGPLSDRIYEAMRSAILSMAFAPGEAIRKELICDLLNVSRAPVADAIKRLAGEGLVDVIPQSGTRISKLSMTEIREGSFLREALETAAAARAAEVRTEDHLKKLSRNLQMQKLVVEDQDFDAFFACDEEFHDLIMLSSGISVLPATVKMVSLQVKRVRLILLPEDGRPEETINEHRRILDAIKDQDAKAAETTMRAHLRQLISRLERLELARPELFTP